MKNSRQFKSTVLLLVTFLSVGIFSGCGGSGSSDGETQTTTPSSDVLVQKGWYVKLTVESDTLKDDSTVFGYLEGASDSKDRYDTESLGTSGLCTTIYHEDFGDTKHYRSDYRVYKQVGEQSDTWIIKVNSSDANADIILSWNGITHVKKMSRSGFVEDIQTQAPELRLMRLVDVETGDVFNANENDMKISFNMGGNKVRTFHWTLLKDGEPEPEVEPSVVRMATPSFKSVETKESDFEFNPPSFEKR